jgi:hypothetical protein
VAAVVVATTVVLVPGAPASANVASGTRDTFVNANSRLDAYVMWNASTRKIQVAANLSTSMATGYCFDSWFDWTTPEGVSHYDARGARTCRNNEGMFSDLVTESRSVPGMQKAGGAYGPNNNTLVSYNDASGASISINTINVNFASTNCSIRWWRRNANDTINTFTGGSPTSASC